jgi:hypothetical protein
VENDLAWKISTFGKMWSWIKEQEILREYRILFPLIDQRIETNDHIVARQEYCFGSDNYLVGFSKILPKPDGWEIEKQNTSIIQPVFDEEIIHTDYDVIDIDLLVHIPLNGISYYKFTQENLKNIFVLLKDKMEPTIETVVTLGITKCDSLGME